MSGDSDGRGEIAALSFEKALAELENIVRMLEGGQAPLEDSIRLYERGAALKAHCELKLREAQLKVDQITLGQDGAPRIEPAKLG